MKYMIRVRDVGGMADVKGLAVDRATADMLHNAVHVASCDVWDVIETVDLEDGMVVRLTHDDMTMEAV